MMNENYSSVDRVGLKKDLTTKDPDHLSLPVYDDSFVAKNDTKLVRELVRKTPWSLNDLKW